MTGDILSISRLRMGTDGHGISTLVAFFDCPLKCRYCINNRCHKNNTSYEEALHAAYTPEELIEVLRKDEIYYLMTKGGVVFGGGEPLLQSAYIHEVCSLIDDRWAKRIETSLNVSWEQVVPLIGDIDEWIIDIKDINPFIYKSYTGCSNENLLSSLLRIKNYVPKEYLHIRVPLIPGYNSDEDVAKSAEWIRSKLEVEPEIFKYYTF